MLLLWLGVLLGVAGICAGLLSSWSTLSVGLIFGGGLLLGLGVFLHWQYSPPQESWWRRRSIQAGTNAVIAATAVIVILGLINFLAVRYPARVDLTEAQLFSLAPQSKQVVRSLKQPLKVLIFDKVTDPQGRTLLEQYQRLSPMFEFRFVDPQAQPGLAQKYQVRTAGAVVLDAGARTKTLEAKLTEVNLTAAIANIVSDRQTQVFVIQGHGELPIAAGTQASLSTAVEALRLQGFKTELLNIVERQQIPQETDVLIIAGPKRAFLPSEIKLLNGYLQQGGRALLMLDPETEHGLDPVLKQWGITLDRRLVVDASGSGQLLGLGPAVPVVFDYGPHPTTKEFAQGISFYPLAQALNVQQQSNQQVTELLRTGGSSWAESEPDSEQLQFDEKTDRQGPLLLGVAIQALKPEVKAPQTPTQKSNTAPVSPKPTEASPSPSPAQPANTSNPKPSSASPSPSASPSTSPQPSASPSPSPSPSTSPSPSASKSPSPKSQAQPSPTDAPKSPIKPKGITNQIGPPKPSTSDPAPSPAASSPSSTSTTAQEQPESLARLVVIGDSDFASSGPFEQVLNGDLFLNAVTWLGSDEANPSLSIRPKEVTNRRLQITPQRQRMLTILGALLPLSAIGIAVTLWWQRR